MNVKRIYGAIITTLGIAGLVYAAVLFISTRGGTRDIKTLVMCGIIGLIFFIAGIGLIRTTKDEA